MAKISVISQIVPNVHFTGVSASNPPHIHLVYNQSFTTSTGERIEFGSTQGNALIIYLDIACTMSGTTVTVPQITIDSTLDSPDNPNATLSMTWYRPLGTSQSFIGPVDGMANLQVPATIASASGCSPAGTCCNWTDLIIFNQGSIPLPLADFYTKPQVDAKIIANLAAGAPATATYIVKTATGSLTNAQSLGLLTTGLLKNTVGGITGTLSTAVADTDFQNALSVTAPLTLVVGPPDTLAMTQASSGVSGFLLGADWTTFNNKANASLGNLSAVAVNASLIPNAAGTLNLGSTALPWLSLIIGNGAANSATFTGTFTANRSVFVPDAASSLGQQFTVVSHQFLTSFSATTGAFTAAQPAFTDISGSATGAQMPATVVQTNQANTYTTGAQDLSAATSLKIPVGAGLQPAVNGQIAYDSTANRFGGGQNSVYATFLTPASTDTLTNKTWNGVVIGTQFGGLGANESAASGVLSLNAGAVVNNSITTNGVAFGAAGNTLSFTSAVANALVTTSAGSVPAAVAPNATNFTLAAGVLNTIQNIATTSTPQFAGEGLNQVAPAITVLGITGATINTQADQTVGSLQVGLNLIKNDANTRTFYDTVFKPTINTGASNTTTTLNVVYIDTVNTALTGTTVNLLSLNFGGVNKYTFNSSGVENVALGYQIGGAAASGNVLRGNGTNFVAAVLAAADLSNGVTGSGAVVLANTPTLITPVLGVATATSINGNIFTTGTYTLTGVAGKTLTFNNSLTLAGTDATTITFQGTDTYVGRATTDTLTNKTINSSTDVLGGVTVTMGSDATGDVYYRNSSGILTRLAVGSGTQFLGVSGGLPAWATPAGTGGTINSATINQHAYYSAATTISGTASLTFDANFDLTHAPTAQTSGSPTLLTITGPAHTTLAASVEDTDVLWNFAANTTQFTGGALHAADIATVRTVRVTPRTYAFSGAANQTINSAATFAVTGTPALGTNNVTSTTSGTAMIWAQQGTTSLNINNQTGPFTTSIAATGSYADSTTGNIFQIASNLISTGTRPSVAVFGGARGDAVNASVWAGNFVGYTNFAGAVTARALELDFGNLVNNASAQAFGIAFSIFGGFATNAPVMQITQGAAGSVALSALRINGTGGTPIVSTGSIIDTIGAPAFTYGMDLNGATVSGAGLRAAYGATAVSARNQAASADIPLIQLQTIGTTTNVTTINAPATITGAAPGTGVSIGNQSWLNSNGSAAGSVTIQGNDAGFTTINLASIASFPSFKFSRADGTSAAFSTVLAGEEVGRIAWVGYDGTAITNPAIRMQGITGTNNWSNTDHGAFLAVATTPIASTTITEVARFQANGGFQISNNATASPVAGDLVAGNQSGVIMYVKGTRLVFAYKGNAGVISFLSAALDAATATWTNNTTPI